MNNEINLKKIIEFIRNMSENNINEVRNKLLLSFLFIEDYINISWENNLLFLTKKPIEKLNNFILVNPKSFILYSNNKQIKYNNKWNKEIYNLLNKSYYENKRNYLFVNNNKKLNNKQINKLFNKLLMTLNININICDVKDMLFNNIINCSLFSDVSENDKKEIYKKFGYEYKNNNITNFVKFD
jgi:hypothetical protein